MNAGKLNITLGCYTDAAHPNGLKALCVDKAAGRMEVVAEYPVSNALYQALSPDGNWLYTCTGEGLAAFRGQGSGVRSQGLDVLDRCDDVKLGGCVCHVAAMPDGKRVVFADYLGGFAGSVAVENGKFGEVVTHRHSGSGPNLPRQDKAHCHQALPTPDGKGYCVVDLGLDQIVEYPSGRVFRTSPSGAGPRHLLFHPDGRLAFLVSELGNLVTSLSWSPTEGFRTLDVLPTIISRRDAYPPAGGCPRSGCPSRGETQSGSQNLCASRGLAAASQFASLTQPDALRRGRISPQRENYSIAAAIRFTPDMKRIVVSNRGEDSLAVYDFDSATGRLAFKSRTFLDGSWPRDFIFVSDDLALVATERSGEVHALRYNAATGEFKVIATLGGLFRPVALCKGVNR